MTDEPKDFKRVHFFTGFQTTADDWNAVVTYDVDKQKAHNRLFHGPGVVPAKDRGFKVSARGRGDLSVEVGTGYALDGQGNTLVLTTPSIKSIDPSDFKLPQTVYVVVRYIEDLTDFVSYKANLEYKGHRRIAERVKLDVIITEPDLSREVEVARIRLAKGVKRITDAKDPMNPGANEIDLRFVPFAGVVGTTLPPVVLHELGELLAEARQVYGHLFHAIKILPAADVNHVLISIDVARRMNHLSRRNLFELFTLAFELQETMIQYIESEQPEAASRKEFASIKKHVELLISNSNEGTLSDENLSNLLGYQKKIGENLNTLFGGTIRTRVQQVETAPAAVDAVFEKMKVRSDDFEARLELDGVKLQQVDVIDILDKKSESAHKFRIVDAKDRYRTRQKLKYPDGVIVQDAGIAFEGGYMEFEVANVIPNKDLIMIQRMDYAHGDWEAEVLVNGKKVGTWRCEGGDRKFRWRNWPFKVPAEYAGDTFLTIRVSPITAERDLNVFRLWFYQPA